MPVFHATFHFSQVDRLGWREQFWWQGASQEDCLADAIALGQARYSILGAGVNLYRVVVSVPEVPRATLSAPLAGTTLPFPAMPAVVAVNVRLLGTSRPPHRRSYALHGLPAQALAPPVGRVDWAPFIAPQVRAWLALLLNSRWCILATVPMGLPNPIEGIAVAAPANHDIFGGPLAGQVAANQPQWLFVETANPPDAPATLCRIYGVQTVPRSKRLSRQVNGTRAVQALVSSGLFVEGSTVGINALVGGKVQIQASQWVPIASAEPKGYVARKIGTSKEPAAITELQPIFQPTPPGLVGLAPIPAEPLNPPVVAPVVNTYQTARDIVAEVFNGYGPPNTSPNPKLGIARATNQPVDTWIVFVSGVDTGGIVNNYELWVNALANYAGLEDPYTEFVQETVRELVPPNSRIFWAGHSLGGMSSQWARRNLDNGKGWDGPNLAGFGTCVFNSPFDGIIANTGGVLFYGSTYTYNNAPLNANYFAYRNDPVQWTSPGGFYAWLQLLLVLKAGPAALIPIILQKLSPPTWQRLIPNPPGFSGDVFQLHMSYPESPELEGFNWSGVSDPERLLPPLTTGPVIRFLYPPP